MEARCQCGAVVFTTPTPQPLALYICHCHDCRRQSSSAFGTSAIFPRFSISDHKSISCYSRPTSSGQTLFCYFCKLCGTRLLHATPGKNVVSVKGGCLDGLDWAKAIHIWTKTAMVPIPEGSESHAEEAEYTDYSAGSSYGSSQAELDQPEDLRGNGGDAATDAANICK